MKITTILLAGGKSTRFGEDKTLLKLDGKTIIEHIVEECKGFSAEILIVSNAKNKFNIPNTKELADIYPDCGPLGGIHAGLMAATNQIAFVTACDMPFFDARLARQLIALAEPFEAVVPSDADYMFPLFGVYKKSILPVIEEMLQSKRYAVRNLYRRVNTKFLPVTEWQLTVSEEQAMYNINYKPDYEQLK